MMNSDERDDGPEQTAPPLGAPAPARDGDIDEPGKGGDVDHPGQGGDSDEPGREGDVDRPDRGGDIDLPGEGPAEVPPDMTRLPPD